MRQTTRAQNNFIQEVKILITKKNSRMGFADKARMTK